MKTKVPIKANRKFWCINCDPKGASAMTATTLKEHLDSVHHMTELKGRKQGIQFLDGADFYSNTFEWTFKAPDVGEVKVAEVSEGPRTGYGL